MVRSRKDADETRAQRESAARRYQPARIELLLVAEAPPAALDRYFYFEDVHEQDGLFRYVCRVALGREPTRAGKVVLLEELRARGIFLIDLRQDPADGSALGPFVPSLVERCRFLAPRRIVLIKTTVFDAAYGPLKAAELPVVAVRIPFPGSGRQREFVKAVKRALHEGSVGG